MSALSILNEMAERQHGLVLTQAALARDVTVEDASVQGRNGVRTTAR